MYSSEDILDGARAIRPQLKELLPQEGERIAKELDKLIAQVQEGQPVANNILHLLGQSDITHDWLDDYIKNKHSDEERVRLKAFEGVPGVVSALEMNMYRCPVCGYLWPQPFIGIPVPLCPNDQHPLDEMTTGGGSAHALEDH